MRLIARRDASLAVALIVGTLIAFERPLRWVLDFTSDLERRYQIDLVPALTLLIVVFVFHQYKKRLQAKMELATLAREMSDARARTDELERLMTFGQSLASALDQPAIERVLWRLLPTFVGERECSVLWRRSAGFDLLLRDARMLGRRPAEALDALVNRAARQRTMVLDGDDLCVPLIAGEAVVGAIVVRDMPILTDRERMALGTAAALMAAASRNAHVLEDARQSSIRDSLTGCVTRAHALELLEGELRRSRRSGHPLSVIMFDLDGFKRINDGGGHLLGDAVLASVGAQLNDVLRSTDTRCRYGGDEFLLILPDTPMLGAQQVAECLRREIASTPRNEDGLLVTASLGVAGARQDELDPTALIARADEALYRAKRAGKNRYCITAGPALVPSAVMSMASAG